MSKNSNSPAKRAGDPTGQWRSVAEASELDRETVLAKLGTPAELSVERTGTWAADPYNAKKLEQTVPTKRRCLDDMRRLSNMIKEGAKWAPKNEISTFLDRLAAVRADLDCVLKGVEALHAEALLSTDQQPVHGMSEQLKTAVDHLEIALDDLIPPDVS